jgi:hypothetical protein
MMQNASLVCAFLACLLLPFDTIPVDNILVPRASVYPVLAGAALWAVSGGFAGLWREQRIFVCLIGLHCFWMLLATLNGLYALRDEQGLLFPLARCLADLISFWAAPLWFASLLARHETPFAFVRWALLTMFALLALYAAADALHLAGWQKATDFLRDTSPLFRKVATSDGWWPPVVWLDARLRSLCGSPPFLAQLLCILLPLLWHHMRSAPLPGALLLSTALLMLVLTKSLTGFLALAGLAACALCLSWETPLRRRLALGTALGLLAALLLLVYGKTLVAKVTQATGRERSAVMFSEFGIMARHPLLGQGYRLSGRGMEEQLAKLPFTTGAEGRGWIIRQRERGPLKNAYPALNAYSRLGAEAGLPGLLSFLAVFIWPVGRALRKDRRSPEKLTLCFMLLAAAACWMGEDSHSGFAPYLILGALVALDSRTHAQDLAITK